MDEWQSGWKRNKIMIIISKIKQRPETGEDSVSNVGPNTESRAVKRPREGLKLLLPW